MLIAEEAHMAIHRKAGFDEQSSVDGAVDREGSGWLGLDWSRFGRVAVISEFFALRLHRAFLASRSAIARVIGQTCGGRGAVKERRKAREASGRPDSLVTFSSPSQGLCPGHRAVTGYQALANHPGQTNTGPGDDGLKIALIPSLKPSTTPPGRRALDIMHDR